MVPKKCLWWFSFVCFLWGAIPSVRGQFAREVLTYQPGDGVAVEFGSGIGYTNPAVVLGPPSRFSRSESSPIDPFDPPYLRSQLLSLGTNGSVTLKLDAPILDDPANAFGLDFVVFGSAGFIITNGNYEGGGVTDGTLFGQNRGSTRVWVSENGATFYLLDPKRASVVDTLYPTDSAGDVLKAVDPQLEADRFAGKNLEGIRQLYAGSAGGAGYDLAWAVTPEGLPALLHRADYVRIEVTSGRADIDAVAACLPSLQGQSSLETFYEDPSRKGWQVYGDADLFHWSEEDGALQVTWDSSKTNSYFFLPLATPLTRQDDFACAFDLKFEDIRAGVNPEKDSTFEVAIGFLNRVEAERTNYFRGAGVDAVSGARSTLELTYFPDTGFGATVSPTLFSSNNVPAVEFTVPFELRPGIQYRVQMRFSSLDRTLRTSILADGTETQTIKDVVIPESEDFDFRLDAFAIASYSDAGQDPEFDGSILAHGWVDNVRLSLPPELSLAAVLDEHGLPHGVKLAGRGSWRYSLERSEDLNLWTPVAQQLMVQSGPLVLLDPTPLSTRGFYRCRAELP